jgi:hypothetical protein
VKIRSGIGNNSDDVNMIQIQILAAKTKPVGNARGEAIKSIPQITGSKSYSFVPINGVGELVQSCLTAGMKRVTVTPNRGGVSCTMTVES